MSTHSVNGVSTNYLPATLNAVSTKTSNSAQQPSQSGQPSFFAQLFSDCCNTSSAGASGTSASGGNPTQELNQLFSSFQTNATQNQGQALDPMVVW